MKKLISLALALMLVLSLSTVAFAAEAEEPTDMSTVTISKTYTVTNGNTTYPTETFNFTIADNYTVTDGGVGSENQQMPTIGNVEFTSASATTSKDVTITLPTYTAVGKYTYTINETAGDTAGVEYHDDPITLVVTVIQGDDSKIRIAAVHAESEGEAKSSGIENVYNAGAISVKKIVDGALGDRAKYFAITVELTGAANQDYTGNVITSNINELSYKYETAPTFAVGQSTTVYLKHDETLNLGNIPYGVTYTVTEDNLKDYTEVITGGDSNGSGTVNSASEALVNVTNTKDGTPDTGITMDSMPYVLLLAVAAVGLVVMFTKKRMMREF